MAPQGAAALAVLNSASREVMVTGISSLNRSLAALRNLSPPREPAVRCEMCSLPLADVHQHLFEVGPQRLLCACDACALLFSGDAADAKYRRVPRRILFLPDFRLGDAAVGRTC